MRSVVLALLLFASCAAPPAARTPPLFDGGTVASPEPHASAVGAAVLRDGGNAVDAAIAVQFALAVTFPNAGNLGGGGFMLVHTDAGETAIDYRETAPAAAHRDLFLDARGDVIPRLSLDTAKAAGVPGTVAGLWLAHRRHGTLPWKRLVAPAIKLAEEGWVLDRWSAASFARERRNNAPEYFRGAAGSLLVQKELAGTLRRIADAGRDGFYRGETARFIVDEMKRSGGIVSLEDLAAYEPAIRTPIEGRYRGCRIVSMPPPSSGGVALLQLLNMTEPHDLKRLGFHSPAHLHLTAEIEKRVFADRTEHLGDPDFVRVPVARLTSKEYCADRMKDFSPTKRSDPAAITHGAMPKESDQTTHFSVVDKWGNAVANTTTLNGSYGCGLVVRGAGFLLNNEMDDFSAKPGVPNLFGVIGREANAIAPRKRMLSSMCPTFVFRDGKLWLVLGSPGGPTIFTTVYQVIVNVVDFEMNVPSAVIAARVHHQWPPLRKESDPIFIENDLAADVRESLAALGYAFLPRGKIGDVQAVEISPEPIPLPDGRRARYAMGFSDPRGIGKVVDE